MNPRIYKKQAKRAVELLRSHGIDVSDITTDPYNEIKGIPCRWHQTSYEYDEWDTQDTRNEWIEHHYHNMVIPADFWHTASMDIDGSTPWPKMTMKQCRERFSTRQIAPGWRWRGGRAVPASQTTEGGSNAEG